MDNDLEQKIKLVDKTIDDFSVDLSGSNFGVENDIKNRIREIFLDNDFASSDKRAQEFIKILSKDETEIKTETIIKAKEVSLGINNWIGNNIDAIRAFRSEDLTKKLVEETKKSNPGISEDKLRSVRRLSQNINEFYNGDGGVENLEDEVIKEFGVESAGKNEGESVGKIRNSWNDTKGIVGVLRQSPQKLDSLIAENEQIERDLDGIKLPYQQNETLASYDRVMNSIKNPEMRKFIESARNKFQTIDRISGGKFGQISNKFVNNSGVKIINGFAAKIGNQEAFGFVQNSINGILKNDFTTRIRSMAVGGVKNWTNTVGNFFKKTTGDISSKIGVGAKKILANNFGKIGGSLIKGLNTAVILPTKLVGSIGTKMVAPFIVGVFLLFFLLNGLQTNIKTSSIVNMINVDPLEASINTDIEDTLNLEQSGNEPGFDNLVINSPVQCSVENKTVASWQCIDGNSSVYLGNENCVTSVTKRRRSICTSGCGLVSTSIVLQAHDAKYIPRYVLNETNFKSYGNICSGIGWNMISNTLKDVLGPDSLNGGVTSCDKEWISNEICNGNVVIMLFGHRPTGGHWVTAVAVLENGDIALKDPSYGAKTKEYNYLSRYLANKDKNAFIRNCLSVKGSYINNK